MSQRMKKLLKKTNELDLQYTEGLITEDECLAALQVTVRDAIEETRAHYLSEIGYLQEGLKNLGGVS